MVPLDRALVSSYRLSIVTMQRFGRNLQPNYLGKGSVPLFGGEGGGRQCRR